MQISLDAERWTVQDDVSLLEALAQVSDKARDRGRIVTSLKIGGRPCTDRELVPELLARTGRDAGSIEASSVSTANIILGAKDAIGEFGEQLKREGASLVELMRSGAINLASVDGWLGNLAEYMEITERAARQLVPGFCQDSLVPWVGQFIEARKIPDIVSMADLLEYELLPRMRRP